MRACMLWSVSESNHGLTRLWGHGRGRKTEIRGWVSDLSIDHPSVTDLSPGIPMTKKKFAELELSLLHLQQNVEIPETHLVIHPVIQRAVEQVCLPKARCLQTRIPPLGRRNKHPAEHIPYTSKAARRFVLPQLPPRSRQLVDQGHSGRDKAHPRRRVWYRVAGNQFLAQS